MKLVPVHVAVPVQYRNLYRYTIARYDIVPVQQWCLFQGGTMCIDVWQSRAQTRVDLIATPTVDAYLRNAT